MSQPTWQVVIHWVSPTGSESVHIAAFDTYDQARQELLRLSPILGAVSAGRLMKSLQLLGDYKLLWSPSSAGFQISSHTS